MEYTNLQRKNIEISKLGGLLLPTCLLLKTAFSTFKFMLKKLFSIVFLFLSVVSVLHAQDDEDYSYNYEFNILNVLKLDYQVSPYTSDLFGDKFDNGTGTVRFEYTDVSIPGNFNIEVAFRRSFVTAKQSEFDRTAGWILPDTPRVEYEVFGNNVSGYTHWPKAFEEDKHCSGESFDADSHSYGSGRGMIFSDEYNHGPKLIVPGKVNEPFIKNDREALQISPSSYRFATKSKWRISCVPQQDGTGEGYKATSPEGITYTFDIVKLSSRNSNTIDIEAGGFRLYKMIFFASKVEDRFGNWVQYNRSGDEEQLDSITSSDGRRIDVGYDENGVLSKVTANNREWLYDPSAGTVTLPDGKSWEYRMKTSAFDDFYRGKLPNSCDLSRRENYENETRIINKQGTDILPAIPTITIKHPEGAVGEFWLGYTVQGRSNVDIQQPYTGTRDSVKTSRCSFMYSLLKKSISGSRLNDSVWKYEYSRNYGHYMPEEIYNSDWWLDLTTPSASMQLQGSLPNNIDNLHYKWVKVIQPDNSYVKFYVNRDYSSFIEGSVSAEEYFSSTGLKTKEVQYWYDTGVFYGTRFLPMPGLFNRDAQVPSLRKRLTKLYHSDGTDTYTTDFTYDSLGNPELISQYNTVNNKLRYTQKKYYHDITNWLIGLPESTLISGDGSVFHEVSKKTYYADSHNYKSLPNYHYSFGSWYKRNASYHTTGVNAGLPNKVEYNTENRWITFSNYKRGHPRVINVPQRYSTTGNYTASREVDDNGWITSTTDFNGNKTEFGYDAVGRFLYVDSVNDDNNWLDTLYQWSVTGEPPKRLEKQCTLNETKDGCVGLSVLETELEFDALLRPVLTKITDVAEGVSRYQAKQFNYNNQEVFSSYWSDSSSESAGNTYVYDGLQRLIKESQTGGGTVYTAYLSGNKKKVTDAEGNITTTEYLAYGAPSYNQALTINSPEGVTTAQVINVFGDITSITQSGPTKSQTEYRAYDAQHHVCKVSRQDVGTTVYSYSVLGELQWQAQGVTGGVVSNCSSNATTSTHADAAKKVNFTYDNVGGLWKADYVDVSSPDTTYTLDKNGNVVTLNAGNVITSYTYNSLHLPETESLAVNGKTFNLDYHYAASAALSGITYPDGDRVDFSPNGYGQPTESARQARAGRTAHTYVNNASYYPSGSINTFSYGNGLIHKTTLNTRKIVSSIEDSNEDVMALHYGYTYDNNLNINSISDNINSAYSLTDLTYDGLDRLKTTSGGSGIGSSSISYDGLGNITQYSSKGQSLSYNYDANTQLLTSVTGLGDRYSVFDYDDRGNIYSNGSRTFVYNRANQLTHSGTNNYIYDGHNRRVMQNDSKGTSYSMYSLDGTLLYRETPNGGINYIYLGKKLIAKDGVIPASSGNQHYRPFGASIEGEVDDVGFTGHKFDSDLGLSYMQARYYDPVIGRFYGNDPASYLEHLQRVNPVHGFGRYTYANNNPYKYVDPDGEFAVVGALVGAGIEVAVQAATGELGFNAKSLGKIALAGAAGVAGAGIATGAARLASVGKLGSASNAALGLGADGVASAAGTAIQGGDVTVGSVAADIVGGKAGGAIAKSINKSIPKSTANADRAAQGKGQPNSRSTTRRAIRQGQRQDARTNAIRDTAAAATGSGLGSKTVSECTSANSKVC